MQCASQLLSALMKLLNSLLEVAQGILSTEWVNTAEALGRVLGKDVFCQKNLPSYNNAALDGFAFAYQNSVRPCVLKSVSWLEKIVLLVLKKVNVIKL